MAKQGNIGTPGEIRSRGTAGGTQLTKARYKLSRGYKPGQAYNDIKIKT